ncbi:9520_t:CDS:2 [Funneliformis caledonium]|uniref:9520_t:CDS:1 n=1 Tax=Funneliformis caledonium TaxID=1117310 RepID=A0A9N8W6Y1_9GLOM|nr:9520_t:CDS:2 [Funneliformis caledonium]
MDENQAFDASKNMQNGKDTSKNTITFKRIRDMITFYRKIPIIY